MSIDALHHTFTNDYEEFDNKLIVVDERNELIGPCPLFPVSPSSIH